MIKCKTCGYCNNDGSKICLNCRAVLNETAKDEGNDNTSKDSENQISPPESSETYGNEHKNKHPVSPLRGLIPIIIFAALFGLAKFGEWWYSVDFRLVGSWQVESVYEQSFSIDDWYLALPLDRLNRFELSLNGEMKVDIADAHYTYQNYKYFVSKRYNVFVIRRTDSSALEMQYKYRIDSSGRNTYLYLYDFSDPSILKIVFKKVS